MKVFLVIEDSGYDGGKDVLSVHRTREGAERRVASCQAQARRSGASWSPEFYVDDLDDDGWELEE